MGIQYHAIISTPTFSEGHWVVLLTGIVSVGNPGSSPCAGDRHEIRSTCPAQTASPLNSETVGCKVLCRFSHRRPRVTIKREGYTTIPLGCAPPCTHSRPLIHAWYQYSLPQLETKTQEFNDEVWCFPQDKKGIIVTANTSDNHRFPLDDLDLSGQACP